LNEVKNQVGELKQQHDAQALLIPLLNTRIKSIEDINKASKFPESLNTLVE
jgi:hypothetical protein